MSRKSRIEKIADDVKSRVIDILRGHTDELDYAQLEYITDKILQNAVIPYVDEWVDIRTRTDNYAHGNH
jgi:hypothetical protein